MHIWSFNHARAASVGRSLLAEGALEHLKDCTGPTDGALQQSQVLVGTRSGWSWQDRVVWYTVLRTVRALYNKLNWSNVVHDCLQILAATCVRLKMVT